MNIDIDPDRHLALAYAPARSRASLESLWRLDVTLGAVLANGRQPMVSRIRLAWWREALERLDNAPPPPEPVLQSIAGHVLPAGIRGADLAAMEEGWSALVPDGPLDEEALQRHASQRGAALFRLSAGLLQAQADVDDAGRRWALIDLARHSSDPGEADAALKAASVIGDDPAWPPKLRPLAMLSALARRDVERGTLPLERQGAPARMLRLFGYRLTGR